MEGCPGDGAWSRLLTDEAGEEEREGLERHLDDCEACRDRLSMLADEPAWDSGGATVAAPVRRGVGRGDRPPVVAGYRVGVEIGRGGMGVVYKALRESDARPVALKVMSAAWGLTADARDRVAREAGTLAKLDHPGIVRVLDAGEADGVPFLAMEWVEGGDLAARLRSGPLRPREAATLARELAGAVAEAHGRGIIHRDVKPSNVLIGPDGAPRLTDFGLAREHEAASALTSVGRVLGTPGFMPPEQVDPHFGPVGPRSDVYGLGATLYAMLTGLPPFRGASPIGVLRQVVEREPVPVRLLEPSVPLALEAICRRCLAKRPGRRYASAEALADDLGRFLEGRRVQAPGAGRLGAAILGTRHRTGLVAVALLALGAAGLALAMEHGRRARAESAAATSRREFVETLDTLGTFYLETRDAVQLGDRDALPTYTSLGWRLATIYERVLPLDRPDDAWSADEVRWLCCLASIMSDRGDHIEATMLYRRCAGIGARLLDAYPEDAGLALAVAESEASLAATAESLGDWDATLEHDERGYRSLRRTGVEALDLPGAFFTRAMIQGNLTASYEDRGRAEDAARVSRASLEFYRAAVAARPDDLVAELQLIDELGRQARLLMALGRPAEVPGLVSEARQRLDALTAASDSTSELEEVRDRLDDVLTHLPDPFDRR
ncbi:serine/threonine-protein kinase [Tautonia rosea]|uniref:serine/threonine-protein kinase n=1 Tax=Tautonia rosea TaxID=2728037 RepID=UPI0014749F2C|nr:serine/threonine-protein kinase [Tautonia rosea]